MFSTVNDKQVYTPLSYTQRIHTNTQDNWMVQVDLIQESTIPANPLLPSPPQTVRPSPHNPYHCVNSKPVLENSNAPTHRHTIEKLSAMTMKARPTQIYRYSVQRCTMPRRNTEHTKFRVEITWLFDKTKYTCKRHESERHGVRCTCARETAKCHKQQQQPPPPKKKEEREIYFVTRYIVVNILHINL